ncbi:MAG: replication-associated recombination protein A [Deltaproteobacteria bacterium]|nr:replication-associated recombination protein A [Deltaproteobacteria bacterium]
MKPDIFDHQAQKAADASRPLAERMRPRTLDEFYGQQDVVGEGSLLRHAISGDRIFSMILWGPPGCGKTTLARIVARETRCHFVHFSAVLSGVKDIRAVIEIATDQQRLYRKKTILFVDEIHRFNKSQQDAFLPHVESGLITLIGATTENPSFEVIPALMSRCRVVVLKMLSTEALEAIIQNALSDTERGLGKTGLRLSPDAVSCLIRMADGDARNVLNSLEVVASLVVSEPAASETDPSGALIQREITVRDVEAAVQKKALLYDKSGEEHYNLISAFHKSLRGSDPDAALYWLERMISSGEDPIYVARRMVRFASEDIGNADPYALDITLRATEAFRMLGHPEGELALAQAAVYLATAPKSNSVYAAMGSVKKAIGDTGAIPVPFHIRNAPTRLMKDLGYGDGYQYAHDFQDAFVPQDYLPEPLQNKRFYLPSNRGYEKTIQQRMEYWRKQRAEAKRQKTEDKRQEYKK